MPRARLASRRRCFERWRQRPWYTWYTEAVASGRTPVANGRIIRLNGADPRPFPSVWRRLRPFSTPAAKGSIPGASTLNPAATRGFSLRCTKGAGNVTRRILASARIHCASTWYVGTRLAPTSVFSRLRPFATVIVRCRTIHHVLSAQETTDTRELPPAHAEASADVHPWRRRQLHDEIRHAVHRHVVPFERLAYLRDLVRDLVVVGEPARPQKGVIEVGDLDDGHRVAVQVEHAAVPLARHFAVDPHRADEDEAPEADGVHWLFGALDGEHDLAGRVALLDDRMRPRCIRQRQHLGDRYRHLAARHQLGQGPQGGAHRGGATGRHRRRRHRRKRDPQLVRGRIGDGDDARLAAAQLDRVGQRALA